jgi:hypothetical protein
MALTPREALPLVTRRQVVQVLGKGISARTFDRLEAEGVLTPAQRGKGGRPSLYDLTVVVPAYLGYLGQSHPATEDREARARRDRSAAELNELKIAELRGALLPREAVVRDGQAFSTALRAAVLALPRRLAQAGLVTPAHEPATTALVREVCEEIAAWRSVPDLERATRRAS